MRPVIVALYRPSTSERRLSLLFAILLILLNLKTDSHQKCMKVASNFQVFRYRKTCWYTFSRFNCLGYLSYSCGLRSKRASNVGIYGVAL